MGFCASAYSPAGPQELQILSKGGPLVSVAHNGAQVASVPCNGGFVFRPGEDGVPPLPWDVKVVDQSTRRVVLDQRIAELPRWLVIFRDSAGVSASPVLGPVVSCNAPL
jgi:predicted DNA-binding protein